jgi:DNA-binding response OmpR family regulator
MASKKILIVDYDGGSREALARLFQPYKFQIISAADGLTAYEKFQLEKPDLVIIEAILPKLHGFDLTRRISQESQGRVPVVIVTGLYRGPQYKHEALALFGASDYFEKPYDSEKLVQAVLNLLKEKIDIGFELPEPEAVIEYLRRKLKRSAPDKGGGVPEN